jgi:hypothetical protein
MINLRKANVFYSHIDVILNNEIIAFYDEFIKIDPEDYFSDQVELLPLLSLLHDHFSKNDLKIKITYPRGSYQVQEKIITYNNVKSVFDIILHHATGDNEAKIENYLKLITLAENNFKKYLKSRFEFYYKLEKLHFLISWTTDKNRDFWLDFYGYKNIQEAKNEYILLINDNNYEIKKAA